MSEKIPTTQEVREYFAYVHDAYDHLSGHSEERAAAFDAWLKGVKRETWWEGHNSCEDTYPWEDNPYEGSDD